MASPAGMEILCRVAIDALIGMGAKEVALRLQDVGGAIGAAVTIVEGNGGGQGRSSNAAADSEHHGLAPAGFRCLDLGDEEGILQQAGRHRLAQETGFDVVEKAAADNTGSPARQSNAMSP